ncbi:MAG: alpha-amylase/4-alpha-glucanotransferase domain-containing protein [Chloroflexota bacterium]
MPQPRISLALVLHNHQPVGNFGHVFAHHHDVAYRPLIEALERHPGVRLGLHYTGPLLAWLEAERPELLARIAALVGRGQVEIVGGGLYEPVLASLPDRDRVDQLRRMGDTVARLFGTRPQGAWLAERVWEPDLPATLADGGYAWTILDDAHFRAAGIPEDRLWAPFSTEDQGKRLTVFGTEMGLRYRIPFGDVEDVIGHLRAHATEAGDRIGVMGDDGEKFGAWPTTWEHCWGAGRWVDRFLDALEGSRDWLSTTTPSAWLEGNRPAGRVYIPTGSYAEMGEWALPPDEGRAYGAAMHALADAGRAEVRWMRGGFWRSFQVKYREINDLHKQMLRASAKVDAMAPGAARDAARDHLHQGQSNDCYWHGLFGGIYIAHMRLATAEHLIAAEDAADRAARAAGAAVDGIAELDVDLDGSPEILAAAPGQVVAIEPAEGAGIGTWDVRAVRHALGAVLRRRPEAYHARLVAFEAAGEGAAADAAGGVASIHDRVKVREAGLADRIAYDAWERRSALVHLLGPDATPEAFARAAAPELAGCVDGAHARVGMDATSVTLAWEGVAADVPVRIEKRVALSGGRADPALACTVRVVNRGTAPLVTRLGVEWALNLLGGGGNPSAWIAPRGADGARERFDGSGTATETGAFAVGNDWIGLAAEAAVAPAADAWWSSIDTVSNSEDGFERTHQGSAILFSWPLTLAPGAETTVRIAWSLVATRDRAADEGL